MLRRPTLRVSEIMQTDLVTCSLATTVVEAAATMRDRRVGAVLVVEDGRLCGIFTERDLRGLVADGNDVRDWPISRVMTADPTMAPPDADVLWAGECMRRLGVRHLPVGEDRGAVGIVSLRDLFVLAGEVLRADPHGLDTARDIVDAASDGGRSAAGARG
jgi:CBS domain-containing protein